MFNIVLQYSLILQMGIERRRQENGLASTVYNTLTHLDQLLFINRSNIYFNPIKVRVLGIY